MKKNKFTHLSFVAALVLAFMATSCKTNDSPSLTDNNPFDSTPNNSEVRNKIVVISDLHLGSDLSYSECVQHLPRLTEFLNNIRQSKTVKELVIAGDMLDEWYVPSRNDTYQGKTQLDFIKKIAQTNKSVIDVLNGILEDGKIKVNYAPGNHDLVVQKECVAAILPKLFQARDDNKLGLGTYTPTDFPQLAVEHGHRYDFFCAPDPESDQNKKTGSILPPGYFFTRIAVNSITNPPKTGEATVVPDVTLNDKNDAEQVNNYIYYNSWKSVLTDLIPVKDRFDDKMILANINNLNSSYSINDVLPHNNPDGTISMNLFNGSCNQKTWEKRLTDNNVPVMTKVNEAIVGSLKTSFLDDQSNVQYFQNKASKVRIVVFGHTHIPMIKTFINPDGKECVYANSGTWVDKKIKNGEQVNQDQENMDFIVIAPHTVDTNMTKVDRYKYKNGKHVLVESKSITL